jgi:GT2 family glycosyltransferase
MTIAVSAVVIAFAEDALVARSLDALTNALEQVGEPAELVVVLNRPFGDLRMPPGAIVVQPGENLGFAGGVARAVAASSGEWIALANDDCVVEPDSLRALLDAGRAAGDIGSVAGLVRFEDRSGIVNSAGLDLDRRGVASERLLGHPAGDAGQPADVFGASAGFALYRRAMLDSVGGLDDSFFAYLEDADLAWRARMAGWRSVYTPEARALHRHSSVLGHRSDAKHLLVGRNRVRMIAKNATGHQLARHGATMIAYDLAYIAHEAVRAKTLAPLRGRLQGLRDWRRYRALGQNSRRRVAFSAGKGLRAARERDRAYRAAS